MVGNFKNLKVSMLAQSSGKYFPNAMALVCKKSGPYGSQPAAASADSSAKMFPIVVALILVFLDVDAELDEVPTITLSLLGIFCDKGKHEAKFFGGQDKVEANKYI